MDSSRRQRWNTDDAYPKSYRERRESHHHEKPEHPKWNGTYNLDTLFEEPEDWQKATALHPYEEYQDPHHYGYSSSPDTVYESQSSVSISSTANSVKMEISLT